MDAVVLLGLLVLGVVVLTPVADRTGVPQPVLLTVYGLLLGLVPGLPAPDLPPEAILPLVLPPLLFAATQSTSVRELRSAAGTVLSLAVRQAVVDQYESRLTYRGAVHDLVDGDGDVGGDSAGEQLRSLLARASEAEREAVLDARRSGRTSPAAADDVLFDVEARALRHGS